MVKLRATAKPHLRQSSQTTTAALLPCCVLVWVDVVSVVEQQNSEGRKEAETRRTERQADANPSLAMLYGRQEVAEGAIVARRCMWYAMRGSARSLQGKASHIDPIAASWGKCVALELPWKQRLAV